MKKQILFGVFFALVFVSMFGGIRSEMLISSANVSYDSNILSALKNQSEVRVQIELNDNSTLPATSVDLITGWFKPVIDNVLNNLSKDEFQLVNKFTDGFSGYISQEGFNKLINDSRIRSIIISPEGGVARAMLDKSALLINATQVWNFGYNGSGVKVCVIDSGVNNSHPDLQGKIAGQYCYCSGHGTHVAGIIVSQDSTYRRE